MVGQQAFYELENAAVDYLNLRNAEGENFLQSPGRQDLETQVFWEGENVQADRQRTMGITEDLQMEPFSVRGDDARARVEAAMAEPRTRTAVTAKSMLGVSTRMVNAKRTIRKDGKILKRFSDPCECTVSVLKANVNEAQMVACPNCGAYGTPESYLDGCDYCGSKYKVSDFKAKVSGFSIVESSDQRLGGIQRKMFFGYMIMFLIIWSIGFFGPMLMFGPMADYLQKFTSGNNMGMNPGAINGMVNGLGVFSLFSGWTFKVLFKSFFALFITTFTMILIKRNSSVYRNVSMVGGQFAYFNEVEYGADIEQRLRSAMLAARPEDAQAFADCDMRAFAQAHQDVFDMTLSKVKFLNYGFDPNTGTDLIGAEATVKLYRMKGNRVKEQYERIVLGTSCSRNVSMGRTTTISAYKCQGCGNGLNIYKGGKCEYCGQVMDKHRLGWVINSCETYKKVNWYRVLPVLVSIAVALFILF